VLAELADMGE